MLKDELFNDLLEYLKTDAQTLRRRLDVSHQGVVDHWHGVNPKTSNAREDFYKKTDTYVLELAAWILDFPGRAGWNEQVAKFANLMKLKTALDFGCGISHEGLQLARDGLFVSLCDVSSASLKFATWRAKKYNLAHTVVSYDSLAQYDLCVLIDVIGHVEDPAELVINLARHCKYLFYTEDFQLPPPQNYWPMHLFKSENFDRVFRGVWKQLEGGFYESVLFEPRFATNPDPAGFGKSEGGVRRHVEGLNSVMSKFGFVMGKDQAFFIHNHATAQHRRGLVYTSHGFYSWATQSEFEKKLNMAMKQSIATAKGIIAVSEEAASILSNHLKVDVDVIGNGVTLSELDKVIAGAFCQDFKIKPPFFLWAKNTINGVCDPTPALELARLMPNHTFVFTMTTPNPPPNVKVIGLLPHAKMLQALRDCSVYLGTTKEQFAVQTLEAMGMSKPILCFQHGGNARVVSHLVEGYIANDLADLVIGAKYCLSNVIALGSNARKKIEREYTWDKLGSKVAQVYSKALNSCVDDLQRPLVSVIIPNYNLNKYLPEALDSVLNQTCKNLEIIVVDDGSTESITPIVEQYHDSPILFVLRDNQGVSAARNYGISLSKGRYICCLDADDKIQPRFLERLTSVLESDWSFGLAYSDFELFGTSKGIINTKEYDFERLKVGNFIPCCNVFRREAWQRCGGYKNINPSWEDYELWLNMGKLGFYGVRVAEPLFQYRKKTGEGRDFLSHPHIAMLRATVNAYHPDLYSPKVSVIIPTYNHAQFVPQALGSLTKQTYKDLEVIVVDDGNSNKKELETIVHNWKTQLDIRLVRHEENLGLAAARNSGVRASRGEYILTLDADDLIKPSFLQKTVELLQENPDISIAYTDIELFGAVNKVMEMPDYDFNMLVQKNLMTCTSLYRRVVFDDLGGYMLDMPYGWEDYDFWIRAGRIGHCAMRIPEPLFMYRRGGETMIIKAQKHIKEMRAQLKAHSPDIFRGERPMGCCGRSRAWKPVTYVKTAFVGNSPGAQLGEFPLVLLTYSGPSDVLLRGAISGAFYNVNGKQNLYVDPRDVPQLLSRGDFVYAA